MATSSDVLDALMGEGNDADAGTVRDYLVELLRTVWIEDEGFSGKRPFGNSGWKYEVYEALAKEGLISAKFDSDGYLDHCDTDAADRLVLSAIEWLGCLY